MRKIFLLATLLCTTFIQAQEKEKKVNFKFYGQIRGDLSYNTRNSQESVDGLFYMYPYDKSLDPNGKDTNAQPVGNFYMLYSRLGVDVQAPHLGKAIATAKVEMDFRGSGTSYAMPRMRQAYMMLDWIRHDLLIGQTWHPLTGEVTPTMLNLSTGAPFQPFSRTPMARYRLKTQSGLQLTAAAMWQMQYNSPGPDGKSYKYLKHSCVPEVYVGIDYKQNGWIAGVGGEFLSLRPRLTSTKGDNTYRVYERISTISAEAHVKYSAPKWSIAAKSVMGSNLAHVSMLGGYACSGINSVTGEQQYTPYRHSSSWVNFVYGKKWQTSLFLGYSKNLGTSADIKGDKYGNGINNTGADIDQLAAANVSLSYVLPHWKFGAELSPTVALYGTPDKRGKVHNTHAVTNCRALAVAMFVF